MNARPSRRRAAGLLVGALWLPSLATGAIFAACGSDEEAKDTPDASHRTRRARRTRSGRPPRRRRWMYPQTRRRRTPRRMGRRAAGRVDELPAGDHVRLGRNVEHPRRDLVRAHRRRCHERLGRGPEDGPRGSARAVLQPQRRGELSVHARFWSCAIAAEWKGRHAVGGRRGQRPSAPRTRELARCRHAPIMPRRRRKPLAATDPLAAHDRSRGRRPGSRSVSGGPRTS